VSGLGLSDDVIMWMVADAELTEKHDEKVRDLLTSWKVSDYRPASRRGG